MRYDESYFIPYSTMEIPPGPWLVFAPHPDDETFGMGGSILLASKKNVSVFLVIMTDGQQGDSHHENSNIVQEREKEARQAADLLGIKAIQFWRYPDRQLQVSSPVVMKVVHCIETLQPDCVFFPSVQEFHPDHRATAEIVWQGLQIARFSGQVFSYEISSQSKINRLIDISDVILEKKAVMNAYCSQTKENNYIDIVLALNKSRTYSLQHNETYAEGFFAYQQESQPTSLAAITLANFKPYWSSEHTLSPKVSIVVRATCQTVALADSLQAIAELAYPAIELIVVFPGEQGNEYARDFKKNTHEIKILNINNACQSYMARAASIGLEAATGEWVLFVDDGTILYPESVALLLKNAQDHEAKITYGVMRYINAQGQHEIVFHDFNFNRDRLILEPYLSLDGLLIHASVANQTSFDFNQPDGDWDYIFRLSLQHRFLFVDHPIGGNHRQIRKQNRQTACDTPYLAFYRKHWQAIKPEHLSSYCRHIQNDFHQEFNQKITNLSGQIAKINHRFDDICGRFDGMHRRFDDIGGRFDGIHHRFNEVAAAASDIGGRFDGIHRRFDEVIAAASDIGGRFDGMHRRFDETSGYFHNLHNRLDLNFEDLKNKVGETHSIVIDTGQQTTHDLQQQLNDQSAHHQLEINQIHEAHARWELRLSKILRFCGYPLFKRLVNFFNAKS